MIRLEFQHGSRICPRIRTMEEGADARTVDNRPRTPVKLLQMQRHQDQWIKRRERDLVIHTETL